jgi:hypothetical protein
MYVRVYVCDVGVPTDLSLLHVLLMIAALAWLSSTLTTAFTLTHSFIQALCSTPI